MTESAEERRWAAAKNLGLRVPALGRLTGQLHADLSVEAWGYRQFATITDEVRRAVCSDQIYGAAEAVATNLVEAALHLDGFEQLIGAHGVRQPRTTEELLDHDRLDMHVVGFFRACGSALDCLAATCIGVLRIPRSMQRASFTWLHADAGEHLGWLRLQERLRESEGDPPGWIAWMLQMRHALMHRGRHMKFLLPRNSTRRVIPVLLSPNPNPMDFARFDVYFVTTPWLPDLAHLATEGTIEENLLNEPAQDTMRSIADALCAFVHAIAAALNEEWDSHDHPPPPEDVWRWDSGEVPDFHGFRTSSAIPSDLAQIRVSPSTTVRVQLAENVRREVERRRKWDPLAREDT